MENSKKDHVSTQVNYDCEDPFVEKKNIFLDTKVSPFLSFFLSLFLSFFLSCFLCHGIMNVSMLICIFLWF